MPSPFPGMNPYLEHEATWNDFHLSFMPLARRMLAEQLRPQYVVKVEERLYVHELPAEERRFLGRADVSVTAPVAQQQHHAQASSGIAAAAPAYGRINPVAVDVLRLGYIEIRDREGQQLVTVVELLSPSNKDPGKDRNQYLVKRDQLLASGAHLVEIDLLRGGPRMPIEDLPDCDYCAMVSRAEERPKVALWPIALREPLPLLPIPVRAPHPDAHLDLQQILNRAYDEAGYEDYIYRGKPQPPLRASDAEWASRVVSAAK